MFTRCPACQTLFRVHADTLRTAHGQVRCGRCATQFNALDSLADDPERLVAAGEAGGGVVPEVAVSAVITEADSTPGVTDQLAEKVAETPWVAPQTPEEPPAEASSGDRAESAMPEPLSTDAAEAPAAAVDGVSPVIALAPEVIHEALLIEDSPPRPTGPRLVVGLLLMVLLALLAGQWVYTQRVALYERPALRPALQNFCAVLGCDLPLPRQPERIEILERVVREHPRVAHALLVELSFVSRANQIIAYPVLEMRLTDVSGNRAAGRRFAPADYLLSGVDIRAGMRPGQPVHVTLELVEPQIQAVSFQFEFF